ncbi:MAG: nucleotide exchange factor GrpE [Anaerorhabdus sp.]
MSKNKKNFEEEKDVCKDENTEECCCKSNEKTESCENNLNEEIAKLKEELDKSKNDYYKVFADTENLKKRLQNDADTLRKYRIQSFATEVLPILDNLDRAIDFEIKDDTVKNYIDGINMIHQQLKTALENEGVSVIESLGKEFDPNIHQALLSEKRDGVNSGIVLEEIQKGYKLKDRVIRASLVKVSE